MGQRTPSDILKRIRLYCARSERCSHDVIIKLRSWGVEEHETDELLQVLERDSFLNNDRFLNAYVTEKWEQDRWGKIKIQHGLRQKGFDDDIIRKVLDTIDHDEYVSGLMEVLSKKRKEFSNENPESIAVKLIRFAASRGFEEEWIMEGLESLGLDLEK